MPLHVGVIVEGHGEYRAVRGLLERVWYEVLGGDYLAVLGPYRKHQGNLLEETGLKATVDAAKIDLGPEIAGGPRKFVLILVDAEDKCPKALAPRCCTGP